MNQKQFDRMNARNTAKRNAWLAASTAQRAIRALRVYAISLAVLAVVVGIIAYNCQCRGFDLLGVTVTIAPLAAFVSLFAYFDQVCPPDYSKMTLVEYEAMKRRENVKRLDSKADDALGKHDDDSIARGRWDPTSKYANMSGGALDTHKDDSPIRGTWDITSNYANNPGGINDTSSHSSMWD